MGISRVYEEIGEKNTRLQLSQGTQSRTSNLRPLLRMRCSPVFSKSFYRGFQCVSKVD